MSGIGNVGGSTPLTPPQDPFNPPAGGTTPAGGAGSTTPVPGTPPGAPGVPVGNVPPPQVLAPPVNNSPLDRPKITIPANLTGSSVGDLIEMIQDEIQKTSDALASIQKVQIQEDSNKQQEANTAQIDKLNKAADQIEQAAKEAAAMKDVQWAMMAFSIFITVCTAGALGGLIGPIMVATAVLSQVPIDGQNMTGWLTTGVGDALGDIEKLILDDAQKDGTTHLSDSDHDAANKSIDDSKNIQATALMIYLEVVIAVVVTCVTLGSGGGESVSMAAEGISEEAVDEGVNIAEDATEEAVEEGTQEAAQAIQESVNDAVTTATNQAKSLQRLQKAVDISTNLVQTAGSLTQDAVGIHTAYLDMENTDNQADADKIKAYTKFLQTMLSQEEDFLKQIIDSQSNIADTVKDVLQTEHSTNMHIAGLTTNA